jgi:hypothetical protein
MPFNPLAVTTIWHLNDPELHSVGSSAVQMPPLGVGGQNPPVHVP